MQVDPSLPANLRLLCSYCRSISAVCRDVGLSRQQFTKYLSGKSAPSMGSLRRICDYFGVEETELLMPAAEFRELISLRPPLVASNGPSQNFITDSFRSDARTRKEISRFLGYYYSHFIMGYTPNKIVRALICIYDFKGATLTKNVERFPDRSDGAASVQKYEGVALYNAERLFIYEKESSPGDRIWQTVVYATDLSTSTFLSGLTMGIATDTVRDIACYRIVYSFLGREIDLRGALAGCGMYPVDSTEIPKFVRNRITNEVRPDEHAFIPR